MKLSRRNFALTLAGAPHILRGQPASLHARVKIDTERVVGDIDPMLYGNFIEHLGRCIDGGIFEEKSPLSDANGFPKDVLEAVRKLNVTLLRWPGGNFSSNYNWRDGIGPRDQRPPRLEMAWGTVENDFDKTPVKTVDRSATAEARRLRYTFPPHSYTMLKVKTV